MRSRITRTRLFSAFVLALAAIVGIGPVVQAATLNGNIVIQTNFQYSGSADLQTLQAPMQRSVSIALASGTGSGQANMMFADERALSSGANESLDLAGGLTDAFGTTITFTTVKAIIVESPSTNTVNVTLGAAASNQFVGPLGSATDTLSVRPGGVAVLVAPQTGWTVTAGTGDLLKVLAGAAAVTYRITIIGTV